MDHRFPHIPVSSSRSLPARTAHSAPLRSIAASLAEICSVFPTSGGVYYWSHLLSTPKYAPIASWITGWLGLVGNWTVTLSINFSFALLILSALSLWDETFVATPWQTVLCFWAVMIVCAAINVFGNKWLDKVRTEICPHKIWLTSRCNSSTHYAYGGRPRQSSSS